MANYELNYEILDEDAAKKNGNPYEELLEWVETIVFAFFAVILLFHTNNATACMKIRVLV